MHTPSSAPSWLDPLALQAHCQLLAAVPVAATFALAPVLVPVGRLTRALLILTASTRIEAMMQTIAHQPEGVPLLLVRAAAQEVVQIVLQQVVQQVVQATL